jgi:hypothetical protein
MFFIGSQGSGKLDRDWLSDDLNKAPYRQGRSFELLTEQRGQLSARRLSFHW